MVISSCLSLSPQDYSHLFDAPPSAHGYGHEYPPPLSSVAKAPLVSSSLNLTLHTPNLWKTILLKTKLLLWSMSHANDACHCEVRLFEFLCSEVSSDQVCNVHIHFIL